MIDVIKRVSYIICSLPPKDPTILETHSSQIARRPSAPFAEAHRVEWRTTMDSILGRWYILWLMTEYASSEVRALCGRSAFVWHIRENARAMSCFLSVKCIQPRAHVKTYTYTRKHKHTHTFQNTILEAYDAARKWEIEHDAMYILLEASHLRMRSSIQDHHVHDTPDTMGTRGRAPLLCIYTYIYSGARLDDDCWWHSRERSLDDECLFVVFASRWMFG